MTNKILNTSIVLAILFSVVVLFNMCSTTEKVDDMVISQEEFDNFSSSQDTLFYKGDMVGYMQSIEWEFLPNDMIRMEISFVQTMSLDSQLTMKIIKYLHRLHPRAKIEVNYDDEKLTK